MEGINAIDISTVFLVLRRLMHEAQQFKAILEQVARYCPPKHKFNLAIKEYI